MSLIAKRAGSGGSPTRQKRIEAKTDGRLRSIAATSFILRPFISLHCAPPTEGMQLPVMQGEACSVNARRWLSMQIFHMRRIVDLQNEIWTNHRIASVTGLQLRLIKQIATESMIFKIREARRG